MNDMGAFEKLVKLCREKNNDLLIDNAAWDHALFLFYNMLEVAVDRNASIRIVTGSMNKNFFCDAGIIERFRTAMEHRLPISVVIVNDPNFDVDQHQCASTIAEYENGHVYVSLVPVAVPHMLLIGDDASCFRLETDHEQTKAVASFNNPEVGKILNERYWLAMSEFGIYPEPTEEAIAEAA